LPSVKGEGFGVWSGVGVEVDHDLWEQALRVDDRRGSGPLLPVGPPSVGRACRDHLAGTQIVGQLAPLPVGRACRDHLAGEELGGETATSGVPGPPIRRALSRPGLADSAGSRVSALWR
jgi:hypothetical protein